MAPPKHMTSADAFPAKKPGVPRLYQMEYCPYVMRAIIMLTKKKVPFEPININLKDKPGWFLEKYPVGTVPVFEIGDKIVAESLIVAEYVDDVYEGEPIISSDPYEKARVKMWLCNEFPKAISSIYGMLLQKENWEEGFKEHVGKLESILKNRKYFAGDQIGYADYMIYPWIRYIGLFQEEAGITGKFPILECWLTDLQNDDTIRKCDNPKHALKRFVNGFVNKNVEYDFEQ